MQKRFCSRNEILKEFVIVINFELIKNVNIKIASKLRIVIVHTAKITVQNYIHAYKGPVLHTGAI